MTGINFHFRTIDYIIFILTLCVSVGIGLFYACTGGKQKTTSEYLMGDKKMGVFPIAMSLMASVMSSLMMVGMATEVYFYGIHAYFWSWGFLLALPSAIYVFIPVFYNLQLVSVYEYVELRFNRNLRYAASILFIIAMTIYAASVIYATAICLRQVTGMNIWWSVSVMGVIGTFYTAIGGIKAVMWTDVVQGIIMALTLLIICVKGTLDVGGVSTVVERISIGGRLAPLSFSLDPRVRYTFWGCTLAPFMSLTALYGVSQIQVQRFLSAPTMKHAQRSVWWNVPGFVIMYSLTCYLGFIIYSKYWECDPLMSNKLDAPDQMVPFFVMQTTSDYPGIAGLFIAGVASGSLSTTSSLFNSVAAIVLEDFVRKINRWKSINDEQAATVSKMIAGSFGLLCVFLASLGDYFGSIIQALGYNMYIFLGASLGMFIGGMLFPWVTSLGTTIGLIFGISMGLWLSIGSQLNRYVHPRLPTTVDGCSPDTLIAINYTSSAIDEDIFDLYKVSFVWSTSFVVFNVLLVSLAFSFITGPNELNSVDPHLLAPISKFILRKVYGENFKEYLGTPDNPAHKVVLKANDDNEIAVYASANGPSFGSRERNTFESSV